MTLLHGQDFTVLPYSNLCIIGARRDHFVGSNLCVSSARSPKSWS